MIVINALIAEDNENSREVIKIGIKKFNDQSSEFIIAVVGEAESYDSAVSIIANQVEPVRLIFLDLHLKDNDKTGKDLCKNFPKIAYIVVTKDKKEFEILFNETKSWLCYYVEKAAEGVFGSDTLVLAINKFIEVTRSDFYAQTIEHKGETIIVRDIAFISKRALRVKQKSGIYVIEECLICHFSQDSHFFVSNIINPSAAEEHSGCLLNVSMPSSSPSLAAKNVIEMNNLDPNNFVKIATSTILNLAYLNLKSGNHLHIKILDANKTISAAIEVYPKYMDGIIEKIANRKVNQILSP